MSLSPEQLAIRRVGIAASEVAGIVGLSPYEGPWSVWAKKQGLLQVEESDEMALGHLLEEPIAQMYARRNPGVVLAVSDTLRHPTERWALATPDRIATPPEGGQYLLEVKTGGPHAAMRWGTEEDDIPEEYICQVQWQMFVTGMTRCDIAGYVGGKLRFHVVRRHEGMIAGLVRLCRDFYQRHLVDGTEPALDHRESTREGLEQRYPKGGGLVRDASAEEVELLARYENARTQAKAAKQAQDAAANALRAAIADDDGIVGGGLRGTWRTAAGGTTSWKDVAVAAGASPELIAQHTTPNGRRLDVRAAKGK